MNSAAGNQPFKLVVDEEACRRCNRCLAGGTCRGNAFIRFDREDAPFVDMSRCWGCLLCMAACPFDAVLKVDYGERTAVGA
jgi:Pyruvate/2-oxoacid:ferredoxin oxidoreductase delta subunit